MDKANLKIAIIGAGVGGLVTAIALREKGFNPQIFEMQEDLKEPNTAITLFPNAIRLLKQFGVLEDIYDNGEVVNHFILTNHKGKRLYHLDLNHEEIKPVSIMREYLYSILVNKLPEGTITFNHALREYNQLEENVKIMFDNNKLMEADLLIGADGFKSRVRHLMKHEDAPDYHGYQIWRAIIDSPFPDILEKGVHHFWGRGKRFGYTPLGNNKIAWWASSRESLHRINHMNSDRKKKIYNYFRNWAYPVPELIKATEEDNITKAGSFSKPPATTWCDGSVVLIGEAAHSVSPNLGMGISLAIEDAIILARCLERYKSVPDALLYYEDARIPRATAVTNNILYAFKLSHLKKPYQLLIRDLALKYLPKKFKEKKIREFLDYNAFAEQI
ncbi:MAG: FAD-dependent monooxygenase [Bacteroidota bacterium]